MIIGPSSAEITSVDSNGYAVVDSIVDLLQGVTFWLSKTGQTSQYCIVTESNPQTKTIGILFLEEKDFGRSDLTNYDGATIDIPEQLWTNPTGVATYGSAVYQGDVTIYNTLNIYGLLALPQYATADLPSAATSTGGIVYDTTEEQPVFSDGSVWATMGGGAGGYSTVEYNETALTQRAILNVVGPGILAADNAGNTSTDVSLSGVTVGNAKTAAAVTYYVNAATGSDTNNGTSSGTPFATINKALSLVPQWLSHTITINVYAGTYAETLNLNFFQTNPGACLVDIVGQDWTAVTPATGISSGTFDAAFTPNPTRHTASVAGAGWTVGNLRGKFVKITSGTNSGAYLPIVDNSATELTLGLVANSTSNNGRNITSATFEIVTPAVLLTRQGSATYLIAASSNQFDAPNLSTGPAIRIRNLDLQRGSATYHMTIGSNASLRMDSCLFSSSSSGGTYISVQSRACALYLLECNVSLTGTAILLASSGQGQTINIRNCGVYGGSGIVNNSAPGLCTYIFGGVYLGGAGVAFAIRSAFLQLTTHMYVSAGTYLVTIAGGNSFVSLSNSASLSNSWLSTGQTTTCIAALQSGAPRPGFNSITCAGGTSITNCAIGIDLQTTHNVVDLTAATITGSTTWGVQMAGNKLAAFNQVVTSSATTMSGNTSGDFTLDGTTATSIADLRADPDKSLVNSDLFNRLCEY